MSIRTITTQAELDRAIDDKVDYIDICSDRYVRVEVTEEVDVSIEDIVAGMDDEDMRGLRDYLTETLTTRYPQGCRVRDIHQQAVQRRHNEHHPGPIWMCPDQICATTPEEN